MKKKQVQGSGNFVVEIKNCQNHSWQGEVTWIEKQQKVPFRSVVELIKLLDSAVGTEQQEDEGEWQ